MPKPLSDIKIHVKFKLAALWTSVMFCYVYADYFNMYTPNKLEEMAAGDIGIGQATEFVLLGVSIMMAIPSLMIFLSVALPPQINRWTNFAIGITYTAIIGLTTFDAPLFYSFFGIIEMTLTLLITWFAWTWTKE